MALIPKQSIIEHSEIKPSAFALWCLLCEVKHSKFNDVFLEIKKAAEANIKKSAYYQGLTELESKGWIKLSKIENGKKFWILLKGFSANVENSANVETEFRKRGNSTGENSANVENISANAESHIRNTFFNENLTKEERDLTRTQDARAREEHQNEEYVCAETNSFFDLNSFSSKTEENPHPQVKAFSAQILNGIRARIKLEKLPPNHNWFELCQFAYANKFTCEQVLLCYDTLERQRITPQFWRKGRTTANTVIENLPVIESLIAEIDEFEKGENGNGRLQKNGGYIDAATRNEQRNRNSNRIIEELFRQGELERSQNLLGNNYAPN